MDDKEQQREELAEVILDSIPYLTNKQLDDIMWEVCLELNSR